MPVHHNTGLQPVYNVKTANMSTISVTRNGEKINSKNVRDLSNKSSLLRRIHRCKLKRVCPLRILMKFSFIRYQKCVKFRLILDADKKNSKDPRFI